MKKSASHKRKPSHMRRTKRALVGKSVKDTAPPLEKKENIVLKFLKWITKPLSSSPAQAWDKLWQQKSELIATRQPKVKLFNWPSFKFGFKLGSVWPKLPKLPSLPNISLFRKKNPLDVVKPKKKRSLLKTILYIIFFPIINPILRYSLVAVVTVFLASIIYLLKDLPSPRRLTTGENYAVSTQIFDRNH